MAALREQAPLAGRDRRASSWSRSAQLRDPPEPAGADPDPRGAPVRAEGRVRVDPGGRAGPGPVDPGRRGQGRRRHGRRARRGPRRRHVRDRPRLPADLPRRDDPDAPADAAQGPVLRARSGLRGGGRVRGGGDGPGRRTRCPTSTSTRCSPCSTPTAGRTCGCWSSASARASRGATRTSADALGSLGPINRDLKRGRLRRSPARDESLARLVHNLNVLTGAVGRRDEDLSELVETSNAALGAVAERGAGPPAGDRASCRGRSPTARSTLADTEPFARDARADPERAAAVRPPARARCATRPRARRDARRPIVRDRLRPLARELNEVARRTCAPRRGRLLAAPRPTWCAGHGKVNVLGNMVAYNPRGAEAAGRERARRGLPLLARLVRPQRRRASGTARTRTGRSRRLFLTASCSNLVGLLDVEPGGPGRRRDR